MKFYKEYKMYSINNERRQRLFEQASVQKTDIEKIKYVVDYFLNRLPVEEIAKIDNSSESKVVPFEYDYSFLKDSSDPFPRDVKTRECQSIISGYTLPSVDVVRFGDERIKVFPTIYALKMGTCIMFASEIQRFAREFGIDSKLVEDFYDCYDYFDGKNSDNVKIKTDRIIKMKHAFNILTVDGVDLKVDIAGALTANDYNKNHPKLPNVNPDDFYFSSDIAKKPFTEQIAFLNAMQSEQSQPQP